MNKKKPVIRWSKVDEEEELCDWMKTKVLEIYSGLRIISGSFLEYENADIL
jgi:hypothetical protein